MPRPLAPLCGAFDFGEVFPAVPSEKSLSAPPKGRKAPALLGEGVVASEDIDLRLRDSSIPYMEARVRSLQVARKALFRLFDSGDIVGMESDSIEEARRHLWHLEDMEFKTRTHLDQLKGIIECTRQKSLPTA